MAASPVAHRPPPTASRPRANESVASSAASRSSRRGWKGDPPLSARAVPRRAGLPVAVSGVYPGSVDPAADAVLDGSPAASLGPIQPEYQSPSCCKN